MDSNRLDKTGIVNIINAVKTQGVLINFLFLATGIMLSSILKNDLPLSFFAGFISGIINQRIFFNSVWRSIEMAPAKAASFAMIRYYTRFGLSLIMLFFLAYAGLNPWALIAGFSLTLLSTFFTIIITAKKEYRQNA
jgi:hypothetical protein